MLKALIEIGKSLRDVYPMPLVEYPYPSSSKGTPPKVLVVELNTVDENRLEFSKIYLADYDPSDVFKKYFFRKSQEGPAPTLSFKLPPKNSTLKQRLGILDRLGYEADKEEIAAKIDDYASRLRKEKAIGKSVLVVLRIDGKWPAENKKLVDTFVEDILENIGHKKYRKYWKVKAICHGCGEKKEVYGGASELLKFYTVDKHGYAPEVDPRVSWKQYALCKDCIFDLERGKRAVEDFLTWSFYGKNFWLLPVSTGNLGEILDKFKNLHAELSGKSQKEGYEQLEDKLIYEASAQKEVSFYHFVFVEKDNQAIRIKLHIEEVLPSVLRNYIDTKKEMENRFGEITGEARITGRFNFNFFSSKNLKATKQKPGFTDEDFFMLVDKVFRRAPVDERYLISKTMSRISKDMAEQGEQAGIPWWSVLEALLSLEFLLEWGILKRKIGGVEMSSLPYTDFFEQHGDFFNHPAKRALVLLGVLVQKFLNYQYNQRNSTPFLKVLKNLRLDQKDVQSIFTALQNKMNEYDIGHWWPELREGISLNFIEAGDKWPLSPDEIGFYIAVGMSLHSHPVFGRSEGRESNNE